MRDEYFQAVMVEARAVMSEREIADVALVSLQTVRRWEAGVPPREKVRDAIIQRLLAETMDRIPA